MMLVKFLMILILTLMRLDSIDINVDNFEMILKNEDLQGFIKSIEDYNNQLQRSRIIKLYDHIPMDDDHIIYLIDLSYKYGVDPDLILAIIWTESTFNPNAKNKYSSARGYGQFIKKTAESIAKQIPEIQNYNHSIDAHNPYINLHMTVYYFNACINNNGGNIIKALRSYRGCHDQKYFNLIMQRRQHIKNQKKK